MDINYWENSDGNTLVSDKKARMIEDWFKGQYCKSQHFKSKTRTWEKEAFVLPPLLIFIKGIARNRY